MCLKMVLSQMDGVGKMSCLKMVMSHNGCGRIKDMSQSSLMANKARLIMVAVVK